MHDSGFDTIEYAWAASLVTPAGIAFTFAHQGRVEERQLVYLSALPTETTISTMTGSDPRVAAEWTQYSVQNSAGAIDGRDKLLGGIGDLVNDALGQALKQLGEAAATSLVALVAA